MKKRSHALRSVFVIAMASGIASGDLTHAQSPVGRGADATEQAARAAKPEDSRPRPRLSWAVTERVRYSGLFNQFRPGLAGDDQSLVFRTTLKGEIAWQRVAVSAEWQDARAYLTDQHSYVSTSLINAADVLAANVLFRRRPSSAAAVPEVLLGRFPMELGSGRLIAQEAYRDVTRTFTGGKARWPRVAGGSLTAFAVLPVVTLPDNRDALLGNRVEADAQHFNQRFWGALYERNRFWRRTRSEAYVYGLHEHDDPGKRETRDRKLWTAGFRVFRPASAGAWDADVESAWQGGRVQASTAATDTRALDVSARLLHLHSGYTCKRAWAPRVSVEYDYGTGDADPRDDEWNRLDGLFGHRRQELGPTSIYGALGRENIDTVGLRLSFAPTTRADVFAVYRVLRLASPTDAFASTGVRDATGRSGRDAGQQLDLRARIWLKPGLLRLDVGVTRLGVGTFLRSAPNATREGNTTFFYGDVTYAISSAPGRGNSSSRP
jgi:hypothetical protein